MRDTTDTLPLRWQRPAWHELANCRGLDPDLFFPERGGYWEDAKAVCAGCDVREECLAYAMDNDERYGIWGGMAERERRRMRAERNAANPVVCPVCGTTVKRYKSDQRTCGMQRCVRAYRRNARGVSA